MRGWHRWSGLLFGVPLALLGLTGSVLVFRDALERSLRGVPARIAAPGCAPLSLDALAARTLAGYPESRLLTLRIPTGPDAPYELLLTGNRLVAVDPCTGDSLGLLRDGRRTWLTPVARVHFHAAAALLAVPWLLVTVTGVLLRRRRWDAHARLGLWTAPVFVLFSATGVMFHLARPAALAPPPGPHSSLASLDLLAQSAGEALPGARLSYLMMPWSPQSPVTVRLRLPHELRENGGNDVHLDPATARVLRVDRLSEAGYRGWYMRLAALHFGEFGGWPVRLLWCGLGFVPAVLFVTRRRGGSVG